MIKSTMRAFCPANVQFSLGRAFSERMQKAIFINYPDSERLYSDSADANIDLSISWLLVKSFDLSHSGFNHYIRDIRIRDLRIHREG